MKVQKRVCAPFRRCARSGCRVRPTAIAEHPHERPATVSRAPARIDARGPVGAQRVEPHLRGVFEPREWYESETMSTAHASLRLGDARRWISTDAADNSSHVLVPVSTLAMLASGTPSDDRYW
jgi:hypothetical protein